MALTGSTSTPLRFIDGWRNKMHFLRRQTIDNSHQRQPLMEETAGHTMQLQLAANRQSDRNVEAEAESIIQPTLMTTIAEDAAEAATIATATATTATTATTSDATDQLRNGRNMRLGMEMGMGMGMGVVIVSMDAVADANQPNIADEAL